MFYSFNEKTIDKVCYHTFNKKNVDYKEPISETIKKHLIGEIDERGIENQIERNREVLSNLIALLNYKGVITNEELVAITGIEEDPEEIK